MDEEHTQGEPPSTERPTLGRSEFIGGRDGPAARSMDSIRATHGSDVDPEIELAAAAPAERASAGSRYDVGEEIARGGMGAILRVRDTDLRRSLAMKVMLGGDGRPGTPTKPAHLRRFLEEAQITAQLAHPGVVPVHELGIGSDGAVFFTMSLVRGLTLSEVFEAARAERDGWDRTRALQTLLRVSETMAFAHAKGVIHRDLKPDNVMVGDFGEVYVMDWGLARVDGYADSHDIRPQDGRAGVEPVTTSRTDTPDAPLRTIDGAVVGTPCYMPPEQAHGRVSEVGPRADVYAIGAMLYELLAGHPPYVESGTTAGPLALLLRVQEGPPAPIASLAATDAPPELLAIAEKAMARAADARYSSAQELGKDVQRFLSGHVVQAHRTGALIELRKWVQRNRGVAATIAAALLVIAGGTTAFVLGLDAAKTDAEDARDVARDQTAAAGAARARAEDLMSFMLFDLRERLEPIGKVALLESVAMKAKEHYDSLPRDDDDGETRLRRGVALLRLGNVQQVLGNLEDAAESYAESLAICEGVAASDSTNTRWQRAVSLCHDSIGDLLWEQRRPAEAAESFRRSLAIVESLVARSPANRQWQLDLADGHSDLADALWSQGEYDAAALAYRRSNEVSAALHESDPSDAAAQSRLAISYSNLGEFHALRGEDSAAADAFGQSRELFEALVTAAPMNAEWLRHLAQSCRVIGEYREGQEELEAAAEAYSRSLTLCRQLATSDPSNTKWQRDLSNAYALMSDLQDAQGDLEAAIESALRALEVADRLVRDRPDNGYWQRALAMALLKVGGLLEQADDIEGARSAFQRAVDVRARLAATGPQERWIEFEAAEAGQELADLLYRSGAYVDAAASYEAALAIAERLSATEPDKGEWAQAAADCRVGRGNCMRLLGRLDEAGRDLAAARATYDAQLRGAPDDEDLQRSLAWARRSAGHLRWSLEDVPRAIDEWTEALALLESLRERAPEDLELTRSAIAVMETLGDAWARSGEYPRAVAIYRQGIDEGLRELGAAGDAAWPSTHSRLETSRAWTYGQAGEFERQIDCSAASVAVLDRALAGAPQDVRLRLSVAKRRLDHGVVLADRGRHAEAVATYDAALDTLRAGDPPEAQENEFRRTESHLQLRKGLSRSAVGEHADALRAHEASCTVIRPLCGNDDTPSALQRDLALAELRWGEELLRVERLDEAEEVLGQALASHELACTASEALREEQSYWTQRLEAAEYLTGTRTPASPDERIERARALYEIRKWAESAAEFERALVAASELSPERGVHYDAACSAALAAASGAEEWHGKAVSWLKQDLEHRAGQLRRLRDRLREGPTPEETAALERTLDEARRHVEWARSGDPDLAGMRGTPEFQALFEGLPTPETKDE